MDTMATVGARVVKGGWVGLYGRPGVVGKLIVHRQAVVSRRPMAGDHKARHHLYSAALAPMESWDLVLG